jgi:hypothetical protein
MLRLLRNSDGKPSGAVRLLAALLILVLTFSALVAGWTLLGPVLQAMFPALF